MLPIPRAPAVFDRVYLTLVTSSRPLAQDDFGFMQFGNDLFDGVTKTWQPALLSARPLTEDLDPFKGARSVHELPMVLGAMFEICQ